MHTDRISDEARRAVIRRLRRAEGQIRAVTRSLEEGGDCVAVVQQLTAAKNAVEKAGVKLLAAGLTECLLEAVDDDLPPEEFERLFLQFA